MCSVPIPPTPTTRENKDFEGYFIWNMLTFQLKQITSDSRFISMKFINS